MNHVSRTELIKLLSGELADERRQAVRAHLETCAPCRALHEAYARVHGSLDAWRLEGDPGDLWAGIEERLDTATPRVIRPPWTTAGRLSRIAAAVAIGIGLGHGLGRLSWPGAGDRRGELPAVSESELMDALGLRVFESPSPAGLFVTVLSLEPGADEEVRP